MFVTVALYWSRVWGWVEARAGMVASSCSQARLARGDTSPHTAHSAARWYNWVAGANINIQAGGFLLLLLLTIDAIGPWRGTAGSLCP